MALTDRILSLVSSIGADIKSLFTKYNRHPIQGGTVQALYELTVASTISSIDLEYTPGYVKVYKNGLLLTSVVDFTATNGTSISFTVPLTSGDEITVDRTIVTGLPKLNPLLIYYGYPIAYKGIWDAATVAQEISNNYKYWVVGDTYQDPLHSEYASTVSIINAVRANGVIVYGYVPIGLNTSGLSIGQIQTRVDQWVTIGVDGIFLDEFGFDYENTRQRQKDCADYVHGKGLPYCANAWTVHDFACDNISELPWASGDWRYDNFSTYNPTNMVLPRNPDDTYMFENFCWDHTGPSDIWATQERGAMVRTMGINKNFNIWALAVFPESVPGTLNTALMGNLKNMDHVGNYISANAYMYDFYVVGSGGYSFGSNGTPIWAPLFEMPQEASQPQLGPIADYGSFKETRYFGKVKLEVINTATKQNVLITSSGKVSISDVANPTLTGQETDPSFTYDGQGVLTRIDYASGNYKLFNYTSGVLTSINYHVSSSIITKTFNYNGDNTLGSIVTTKV